MRAGVTGGAGYIGSHVVADLLDEGHEVFVIDNMVSGSKDNLFLDHPLFHFQKGDILNASDLTAFFQNQLDCIFHFSAYKAAGESMLIPSKYSANNIRGSFHLLEAMIQYSCPAIVFSSTAAVYGEPVYNPIDEKHPTNPMNYYGFTKLCIEQNLQWHSDLHGIHYASLRYFNAAGYDIKKRVRGLETNPQNLLPIVMEVASGKRSSMQIYGNDYPTRDGSCIRDYIHVSDLAKAHILSMQFISSERKSVTLNLGSQNGISVFEMIQEARKITGKEIKAEVTSRRPGDPPELIASSALAKELLNWKAEYSDASSLIASTWDIYKDIKWA